MCACYYHLRRKGNLRDGQEHLSPRASGLGISLSPAAGVPTLPDVITELGMVPAEGVLSRGLRRGQHVGGGGGGGGGGDMGKVGGGFLEDLRWQERLARGREATRSASRDTCSRNCLASESSTRRVDRAGTVGADTSIILSAISVRFSRVVAGSAEASTILTLGGNRWRNSSRRNELVSVPAPSLSPSSCCILLSNCVGFRSPNSSPLINCWSLRCSDAAVRLMSCAFQVS